MKSVRVPVRFLGSGRWTLRHRWKFQAMKNIRIRFGFWRICQKALDQHSAKSLQAYVLHWFQACFSDFPRGIRRMLQNSAEAQRNWENDGVNCHLVIESVWIPRFESLSAVILHCVLQSRLWVILPRFSFSITFISMEIGGSMCEGRLHWACIGFHANQWSTDPQNVHAFVNLSIWLHSLIRIVSFWVFTIIVVNSLSRPNRSCTEWSMIIGKCAKCLQYCSEPLLESIAYRVPCYAYF